MSEPTAELSKNALKKQLKAEEAEARLNLQMVFTLKLILLV